MSTTVPRELMLLVERVVRPLPMPLSRQKRLRTEFLEHLQMIYAEELARDGDSTGALSRTRQRFGDPERLTAELHHTAGWRDRAQRWFERLWTQETQEPMLKYLARVAGWTTVSVSLFPFGLPVYPLLWLADPSLGLGMVVMAMLMIILTAGLTSVLWSGFLFCSLKLGEELSRPAYRWANLAMYAFPIVALGPICLAAGVYFSGTMSAGYPLQTVVQSIVLCVTAMLMIALAAFLGIRQHREKIYRREWAELELDAA